MAIKLSWKKVCDSMVEATLGKQIAYRITIGKNGVILRSMLVAQIGRFNCHSVKEAKQEAEMMYTCWKRMLQI